jgi:hypothetical protein
LKHGARLSGRIISGVCAAKENQTAFGGRCALEIRPACAAVSR